MECNVISISRALAAGGDEISRSVAEKMGFRFVDDEILARAAHKAGVSPDTIAKVEQSPSLVDRILKHLGSMPVEVGHGAYVPLVLGTSESYESLITQVIREVALAGKVVIHAHGGSIALRDPPGTFRVLITGSPEVRAARLAHRAGMESGKARKDIDKSDRERQDFLDRFYGVQHELPTHYDLVVNTDRIAADAAAALIVSATSP